VLGRVTGAHGLAGEVRVRILGDGPENLSRAPELWLAETPDGASERGYRVESARAGRPGEARLRLSGIADRDEALALRGSWVLGDSAYLEELDSDEYYWHELIGCRVEASDGRPVGIIREIWETGAHDVLVVEREGGEQVLLSTARELMPEVDLEAGRVVVEILPGMLAD